MVILLIRISLNVCSFFSKERTSLQQRIENERRELEQAHLRNVRDMQQRLSELEETTKVCLFIFFIICNNLTILKKGINKFKIS